MQSVEPNQLVLLEKAVRSLDEADSLEDIKEIRDKAEAVRIYAKASKLGLELQNRAAELKLCAERKAGSFLSGLRLRGGDRRSETKHSDVTLDDLGISRHESSRWQLASTVPEKDFRKYLDSKKDHGEEVTAAGLLRLANLLRRGKNDHHPSRSPVRRNWRSTAGSTSHRFSGDPSTLFEELKEHRQLLTQILEPLYDVRVPSTAPSLPERGECRAIGHLLREMADVIATLEREFADLKASQNNA